MCFSFQSATSRAPHLSEREGYLKIQFIQNPLVFMSVLEENMSLALFNFDLWPSAEGL